MTAESNTAPSPTAPYASAEDRLAFLRIDAETRARLLKMRPAAKAALPEITEEFYRLAAAWPGLAARLGDPAAIARLAKAQSDHWSSLFAGEFDPEYFVRAGAVGRGHERLGLEPRWSIAGCGLVLERLAAALVARHRGPAELARDLAALLRAGMLDLDLAVSRPAPEGDGARLQNDMQQITDVLDRELQLAAGAISMQAARLADGADALTSVAEKVRSMTEAVGASVASTAETVISISGAARRLELASREIGALVERSAHVAENATEQATAASGTVRALNDSAGRINDVVRLVRGIAEQTRLLALNATIEAARAGDAGRGFAVVASEVKTLARATENAIGGVNAQADAVGRAAAEAGGTMSAIGEQIRAVSTIAHDVVAATGQQREATGGIAISVEQAARQGQDVAARARGLRDQAVASERNARVFKDLAVGVADGVADLRTRMTAILRNNPSNDRRRHPRQPMSLQVAVSGAGFSGSGTTIDMSGGGMLIAIKAPETLAGTDVSLDVQRVGKLTARVLAATNLGLHLQFTGLGAEAHARVVAEIEACKAQDVGYIARAVETAKRVALAFEGALDDRRISEASLFDTLYVPVPDTDPEQVTSGATATCEALLPGIIDPAKESDSKIVFCIACDRNGYIPVHNREYSQPQRPGQRDWNIAHSRNRRLFTDRAALLAARNTEPHIVQSYLREMGGGVTVPLKEFDAPILVSGRHWGAIRLAVTP